MTTNQAAESVGTALAAYAQRLCQSAGTDLDAPLAALTCGRDAAAAPAALRAGWQSADLALPAADPTLDVEEPTA